MSQVFNIIITVTILTQITLCLYSPYYKRCRIGGHSYNSNAIPIQRLQIEKVPHYPAKHHSNPVLLPQKQLKYQEFDFFYRSFLDSGGSGQVFTVEDAKTNTGKIVKRYFQQRPQAFRQQNYIYDLLKYQVAWSKDCGQQKCTENSTKYHTLAIFPQKETMSLKGVEFDHQEAPLIFLKLLIELEKTHNAGIIHHDIKLGNILINSKYGSDYLFYETQIIDWNGAAFYHTGYDSNHKIGTKCYYAPQVLFNTNHNTPASDIWSMGIAFYYYATDDYPFKFKCGKDNMRAILSLVGAQKFLNFVSKYNYASITFHSLIKEVMENPKKHPPLNMSTLKPKKNAEYITPQFLDMLSRMLQIDPEQRATAEELQKMPYFKKLRVLPKFKEEHLKKKQKKAQKQEENKQEPKKSKISKQNNEAKKSEQAVKSEKKLSKKSKKDASYIEKPQEKLLQLL